MSIRVTAFRRFDRVNSQDASIRPANDRWHNSCFISPWVIQAVGGGMYCIGARIGLLQSLSVVWGRVNRSEIAARGRAL